MYVPPAPRQLRCGGHFKPVTSWACLLTKGQPPSRLPSLFLELL